MMEAALVYGSNKYITVAFVSQKHTIPKGDFDGIVEKLCESKLIVVVNGKLHLMAPPKEISVWQIISSVAADDVFTGRYFNDEEHVAPTSAITMIHKERETVLLVMENRLRRQKLSAWSEKASKTIYI